MLPGKICRRCKNTIPRPTWRRYKNGSVHLLWQCECGITGAQQPIPARLAEAYGLESKDQAMARLSVEADKTW